MYDIAATVSQVASESYSHTRKIMPEQPWWNNLESSFHKFPDDFELDLKTGLMVDSTAIADYIFRTAAAGLLTSTAMPLSLQPLQLKKDSKQFGFYQQIADEANPETSFPKPDSSHVNITTSPEGFFRFKPNDGVCELLKFDSPFTPLNPAISKPYLKNKRNRQAIAQYCRHGDSPRPTICVIHGFLADPYWLNRMFFALPWFYKQGYDILLYTLPHHGRRKSLLSPFSGHGFFANGISHLNESMAQTVHDFRIFMDYLESRGVTNIGVTGVSLGGYAAALLAAVEARLKFAIPNVPVTSMFDLFLEWFPLNLPIKGLLALSGASIYELRHALAVHSPLTYPSLIDNNRLMVIAGAGDRLASPKHARLLWDHWDRPRMHWFPGNHIVHLDKGKYLKEMAIFMKEIEFDKQ